MFGKITVAVLGQDRTEIKRIAMFANRGFLCQFVMLLLALAVTGPLVSAADPVPRVDDAGDPLPEGAIARIGTLRLRQPSEVCSVTFSPDGKLLATGGRYDGVRLWDAATGKLIRFLPAKGGQGIFGLSFSPDSKSLVSSGTDGALEIWDVAGGKLACQLVEKGHNLDALCYSDDGKFLAVAENRNMRVWETVGWTERKAPESHDGKVRFPSFAGKRMYVSNERYRDYLWDLSSLERKEVPKEWRTGYWSVLSPDSNRLASSGWKTALVMQRDIATGKELHRLELEGKKEPTVNALCYSPDGKLLAVGGQGIALRCLDAETGKEKVRFGDQEVDYCTQLAFSRDGKRLASARGNVIRLWEVGTGKELLSTSEPLQNIRAVGFSPNGTQLAFSDGNWLRLYDLATRKQVWRCAEERHDAAGGVAFAPDGNALVVEGGSRLRFYDARTGKVTNSWGKGLSPDFRPGDSVELGLVTPDLEKVISMQVSAFEDPSREVLILGAKSGKELLKFQRRTGSTRAVCLSPNGQVLAIGDSEGPIQLYNIATGKWVGQVEARGTDWGSLCFAPDGRSLASRDSQGSLQLLELATGKARLVLSGDGDRDGFVYSPDGKVLASRKNKTVELLDTFTGRKLRRLDGHTGRISRVAFPPVGNLLATASEDTTILLWDMSALIRPEKPIALTREAVSSAWNDLTDANATRAYRAMASLYQSGPQAVDLLRDKLRPEQMPDAKQIDQWLKDLDHPTFKVREEVTRELEKHADVLLPTLKRALAARPPAESSKRLTQLVEYAEEGHWTPDALRTLRAIEILEYAGSTEARKVLEKLAGGVAEARLTREAKASLERLAR
jgi:WD40 repeat protein